MKTLILILFAVTLSSCALFESVVQSDGEIRITKCDSMNVGVVVPKAIPNIPSVNFIETVWNSKEQTFYAHWCYSVVVEKSTVEKITDIINKVTAIIERVIKIIYQIKS